MLHLFTLPILYLYYSRLLCRPFCFGAVAFELSNNKKPTFKKVLHQILCCFVTHRKVMKSGGLLLAARCLQASSRES